MNKRLGLGWIDAVGVIRVRPNGGAPAETPVAQAQMWRSGDEFREEGSANPVQNTCQHLNKD